MRSLGALFLGDFRRPVVTLPVDRVGGRWAHAFPPDVAVVGQRDVGEDGVFTHRGHAVEIGFFIGENWNNLAKKQYHFHLHYLLKKFFLASEIIVK